MTETMQKRLLESVERLSAFLEEAHQDEIDADHHGDDSCSYCEEIKAARELIAECGGEVLDAWNVTSRDIGEDYQTD